MIVVDVLAFKYLNVSAVRDDVKLISFFFIFKPYFTKQFMQLSDKCIKTLTYLNMHICLIIEWNYMMTILITIEYFFIIYEFDETNANKSKTKSQVNPIKK